MKKSFKRENKKQPKFYHPELRVINILVYILI